MSPEVIKSENERLLREMGIDVNSSLPEIESVTEVEPRTVSDVAKRVCALSFMIRVGYGYPVDKAKNGIEANGLWSVLGSKEVDILFKGELTEQDKINLGWQAECVQSLAWALYKAGLNHLAGCDADLAHRLPFEDGIADFVATAKLRPIDEIQKEVDLIFRMH